MGFYVEHCGGMSNLHDAFVIHGTEITLSMNKNILKISNIQIIYLRLNVESKHLLQRTPKDKNPPVPWKWLNCKVWNASRIKHTQLAATHHGAAVCSTSFHHSNGTIALRCYFPFFNHKPNARSVYSHRFFAQKTMHLSISFIICTSNNEFNMKVKSEETVDTTLTALFSQQEQ